MLQSGIELEIHIPKVFGKYVSSQMLQVVESVTMRHLERLLRTQTPDMLTVYPELHSAQVVSSTAIVQ
jgi:hypothetical protein